MKSSYIIISSVSILLLFIFVGTAASAVLNLDYCRFRGENGKVIVEIYTDLPRTAITHRKDSTGWTGIIEYRVVISRSDFITATDRWTVTDFAARAENIGTEHHLIDARLYYLQPGRYNFAVTAHDEISGGMWSNSVRVDVETFSNQKFDISDIQIGSNLIPEGAVEQFDRNGFGIIPNPEKMFGNNQAHLIYYVEFYPAINGLVRQSITIDKLILNGIGEVVRHFEPVSHIMSEGQFFDVDSISLVGWKPDIYQMTINATTDSNETVERSMRFIIVDVEMSKSTPVSFLDSVAIEAELNQVRYLLAPKIRKRTATMTSTEKSEFLNAFWMRHDDDPSTADIPARRRFHERAEMADERYHTSRKPGHQTDRGRVYVIYGEPDSREFHTMEISSKPYEIWEYDRIEGGVLFVFVDRSSLNEYGLVHSTKSGEIFNASWYGDYVDKSNPDSGR